jgi:hypothetical protein
MVARGEAAVYCSYPRNDNGYVGFAAGVGLGRSRARSPKINRKQSAVVRHCNVVARNIAISAMVADLS